MAHGQARRTQSDVLVVLESTNGRMSMKLFLRCARVLGTAVFLFCSPRQEFGAAPEDQPKLGAIRVNIGAAANLLVFSPDGKVIAAADAMGRVAVFDAITGRKANQLAGHRGGVSSMT